MLHTFSALSPEYLSLAERYFPMSYKQNLNQNTYEQSIVARYLISQMVEKYWNIS